MFHRPQFKLILHYTKQKRQTTEAVKQQESRERKMWEGRQLLGTIFVRWRRKHCWDIYCCFYLFCLLSIFCANFILKSFGLFNPDYGVCGGLFK